MSSSRDQSMPSSNTCTFLIDAKICGQEVLLNSLEFGGDLCKDHPLHSAAQSVSSATSDISHKKRSSSTAFPDEDPRFRSDILETRLVRCTGLPIHDAQVRAALYEEHRRWLSTASDDGKSNPDTEFTDTTEEGSWSSGPEGNAPPQQHAQLTATVPGWVADLGVPANGRDSVSYDARNNVLMKINDFLRAERTLGHCVRELQEVLRNVVVHDEAAAEHKEEDEMTDDTYID